MSCPVLCEETDLVVSVGGLVAEVGHSCTADAAALEAQQMHPISRYRKALPMSRSASTPSFRSMGSIRREEDLEVYVVLRNFQEFGGGVFHRLPEPLRDGLRDTGVCHYMTVFKQNDGSFIQFDFGPSDGGDIHVSAPGPFGRVFGMGSNRQKKRVGGQVREIELNTLPDSHMYMGTTNMSLSDIRSWNQIHAATEYELHRSDCRHYVNALVRYTTGVDRAAASALRHQWAKKKSKRKITSHMIRLGQYFTDVANWERVRALSNATGAALMTLAGHQSLARLGAAPFLSSVRAKILPSARGVLAPIQRTILQRPVYAVSTAAVASTMASSTDQMSLRTGPIGMQTSPPIFSVQTAVRTAVQIADNIGKSAAAVSQRTAQAASGLVKAAARQPGTPKSQAKSIQRSNTTQGKLLSIENGASEGPKRAFNAVQHLALIAARR